MADLSIRDSRGEWQPESLPKPNPSFQWPLHPIVILKYLFWPGGLILSWNALYLGLVLRFKKTFTLRHPVYRNCATGIRPGVH